MFGQARLQVLDCLLSLRSMFRCLFGGLQLLTHYACLFHDSIVLCLDVRNFPCLTLILSPQFFDFALKNGVVLCTTALLFRCMFQIRHRAFAFAKLQLQLLDTLVTVVVTT